MRIMYIAPPGWQEELGKELGKHHEIVTDSPDVIIGMSVTQMARIWAAVKRYPTARLFNYNWDVYSWVWSRPRKGEYDYTLYGQLLNMSDEVWVPSVAEGARTKKWFGITPVVIPTWVPLFEHETKDENYVLNPLRQLPDEHDGWFEKACGELGIPFISNKDHGYEWEEYKKVLAHCSFLCSPYKETSTGGLDLVKGLVLGKVSLVYAGSGARDYLKDNAFYFETYEELKDKLQFLWENRPTAQAVDKSLFSIEKMCHSIRHRLERSV